MKQFLILLLALTPFMFTSCDDDDNGGDLVMLNDVRIENLNAPADIRDPQTGEIIEEKEFVFFSLSEESIVDESNANWDIGLKGTTIIINGGISGPGEGGAVVLTGTFEDITEAPADSEIRVDSPNEFAIPNGSGNGWYNYNPAQFTISPIPGRVLIIRTHDGKYAKMEVLSYYKDAPAEPDAFMDEPDFYTFRYVLNESGGKTFE